jgi:hypothetical protein
VAPGRKRGAGKGMRDRPYREHGPYKPDSGRYFPTTAQALYTATIDASGDYCIKLKNGVFWDATPCGSCKN